MLRDIPVAPQTRQRQPKAPPPLRMQRLTATRPMVPRQPASRRRAGGGSFFSLVDRMVISAGVLLAVASASFATYMVTTDHSHPEFNGIQHLMIFARPSHGLPNAIFARVPGPRDNPDVDFLVTGSIPETSQSQPPSYILPSINAHAQEIIKGFTLRGVSGNVAVVDGPDGTYRLEEGSDLPGGGRVLAIQWQQGKFVVVTTRGIIREAQP